MKVLNQHLKSSVSDNTLYSWIQLNESVGITLLELNLTLNNVNLTLSLS